MEWWNKLVRDKISQSTLLTQNQNNALLNLDINSPTIISNFIDDLLSVDQFENLLNLTPFTSSLRFHTTYSIPNYEWNLPHWNTGSDHWPISIIESFLNNGVCYLVDCSRVNSKINNICKVLEEKTNQAVDAHIYFSKLENIETGFGVHKDSSHNLIIQVQGKTHWKVGSIMYTSSKSNIKDFYEEDELSIDTVLEPGDAIFIPANIFHGAHSLSKRISISFPIATSKTTVCEERKWINWDT
jgi:hypothetical protein